MRSVKCLFVLLFFFAGLHSAKADQWEDPSWREMIDSSAVIALVKYTAGGEFRAPAQVLTVYKGAVAAGDPIWISGFRGRHGPYDTVSKGDTYLVFLTTYQLSERERKYWDEQVKENPGLKDYVAALMKGEVYFVWTPTAGDLRVKDKKVQYDLLQTSYYSGQPYYSFPEFETFLRLAISGKNANTFHQQMLARIRQRTASEQTAQDLMMLYLTRYSQYNALFDQIRQHQDPAARFALALLMGNIKSNASRQLLVQLLDDQHSLVQGEAVRQLSSEPADFIGPILLRHLQSAGKGNAGPSNIMDPVTNTISGGKAQIIETLGNLDYKPAIPHLLPLLDTEEDYNFNLVIATLKQLGSKDYTPYLVRHLETGTSGLVSEICSLMEEDSLYECVPALMKYISMHDRNVHPSMDYMISTYRGLAHFDSDTVRRFLVADFKKVLKMPSKNTWGINNKRKWTEEYIETFTALGIDTLKPYLYGFLYDYYGVSGEFKRHPEHFAYKKHLEDSLAALARAALPADSLRSVQVTVYIRLGTPPQLAEYVLKYVGVEGVWFNRWNQLLKQQGLAPDHLVASVGSFSNMYGDRTILNLDEGVMKAFLAYISTFPDAGDIQFMENLERYGYAQSDYEKRKLKEYLETARKNVK